MVKLTKGKDSQEIRYIDVKINGFDACKIYRNGQIDFNSKQYVGFELVEMKQFINIMENFNLFYDNL